MGKSSFNSPSNRLKVLKVSYLWNINLNSYIEHVLHHLAQISTYQVTDWSTGPRPSAFPQDILDTVFMTSLSDTN